MSTKKPVKKTVRRQPSTTALVVTAPPPSQMTVLDPKTVESVLLQGDLSRLSPAERVSYYKRVCESLGLNPLTKPFDYLKLNGREVLYAKRDATEQLRKIHGVSITEVSSQHVGDVFVVTAKAQDARGRLDASTGAVSISQLRGENLANALMKAETKAKRRVTLSICGLGLLDETELDTMPDVARTATSPVPAFVETVNTETGEVHRSAPGPERETPIAQGQNGERTITVGTKANPGQREHLWGLLRKSGRPDTELKMWLKVRFGLDHLADIKRKDYEYICTSVLHPGPLPLEAEPGEQG